MIEKKVVNEARALIGSMLRDLRKKKGLSQTEVAEFIGVSTNTISKVEIGKFDFGVDILTKLSVLYGFTINFGLKEVGKPDRFILQQSEDVGYYVVTDTENQIVCKFEKGRFNDTQNFTFLGQVPPMSKLPTLMRELGDWLASNHRGLV